MTRYRFLDSMGDVVDERDFAERDDALSWEGEEDDDSLDEVEVTRVEYLGPEGDWRWAGALQR